MYKSREERQEFYQSRDWKTMRKFVLDNSPLCIPCLETGKYTKATEVHHIIDIKTDPTLMLEITNLQPICKKCHSSITLKETRSKSSSKPKGHIKRLYNL